MVLFQLKCLHLNNIVIQQKNQCFICKYLKIKFPLYLQSII